MAARLEWFGATASKDSSLELAPQCCLAVTAAQNDSHGGSGRQMHRPSWGTPRPALAFRPHSDYDMSTATQLRPGAGGGCVFSWPVDGETPMMKARIISVVILVAMAATVLAPLLRAFGK